MTEVSFTNSVTFIDYYGPESLPAACTITHENKTQSLPSELPGRGDSNHLGSSAPEVRGHEVIGFTF